MEFRSMAALAAAVATASCADAGDAPAASGIDPIALIHREIAAGSATISVPCARYWLTPPDNATCYLELKGLSDVTIDFGGSELIGTVKTSMLDLESCTNVTLKNVSIDYSDLPFTQARIEAVGPDGAWDVRVIDGYPCPDADSLRNAGAFWPVQAYDANTLELKNPMRFRDGIAIERTGERTFRITGGENRRGDVGDIAVWSLKEFNRRVSRGAIGARNCKGCTFENVTVYATPHGCGFAEFSADGNRYIGCSLVRRPRSASCSRATGFGRDLRPTPPAHTRWSWTKTANCLRDPSSSPIGAWAMGSPSATARWGTTARGDCS